MNHGVNHYEVLGLTGPLSTQSADYESLIKRAYHNALLKHHPDKAGGAAASTPSIDTVRLAFTVLSDPVAKAKHDQELLVRQRPQVNADPSFRTGEDLIDLDDMSYDPEQNQWYRGCRCGEDRGYVATEDMLEVAAASNLHEILISCTGCSLWLRVAFDVAEEPNATPVEHGS